MKKVGEFLGKLVKSHAFWWFVACVIISVFIWFVGPAIAFYDEAPLAGVMVRLLLIIVIFLVWFIIHFKDSIKERALSHAHHQKEAFNQGEQIDRREKKLIRLDFKKLKSFLLRHSKEKKWSRETLYDLPWYLVMGEEGAGKTSLLRDAELHLTYQSYNHISHRTATFQWVLAEEGLFIDLPHDFCWQKNAQQKFNWQMFLKYLRKTRVRRPLNGVILTINLRELAEGKLDDWQESVRVRIHELQQKLGMQIPVYVVLTHVDSIAGFPEFAMRFTDKERAEVMGVTFDTDDKIPLDRFPFRYDEMIAGLNMRLKRDLDQEWMSDKSGEMYYFPMQMAALREKLLSCAKTLFSERRYFSHVNWRGLYFVSNGVNSNARYDVILDEATFDVTELPKAFKTRRFFIEGLFSHAILKESEIVGVQPFYAKHYSLMHKAKLVSLVGGTAVLLGLWVTSMVKHDTYNQTVLATLQNQTAKEGAVQVSSDQSLNAVYGKLNTLGNLYHQGEDANGSFWLHLGLLSYPSTVKSVKALYSQALSQNYLPYVMNTLHSGLEHAVGESSNNSMNNVENLYNWLSAYLMFNELKQMNITQVENLLDSNFAGTFQGNAALQNWLDVRLNDLLQFGFSAQTLDQNLIQKARRALWNSPVYMQAYLLLKINAIGSNQNSFAIAGQMSADSTEVFNNLNQATVPAFFTKQGYDSIYEKQASDSLDQVAHQSWVLGSDYHVNYSDSDLKKYQAQMNSLYWTDYINVWDNALSQVNVASFQNLQQEIDVLSTLTQKDSPIVSILQVVKDNSDYGNVVSSDMSGAGFSGKGSRGASLASHYASDATDNIVTNHYLPLIGLLQKSSQGEPIQNVITSLVALQQYLQGIANSSNPGLSAYTAATQIFAGQADKSLTTLAAEAAQAPMPLSRWLNQIVNNSYAVIFASANQYLSTQWQSQVYSYYHQALSGRFPFSNSSSEVTIQDFTNFFKPGGVEDSFVKKYLSPFLTADSFGHTEWSSVNNIPFSSNLAIPQEVSAASIVRNTFFGSANGSLNFTISPVNSSGKVIIAYDGKSLTVDGDDGGPGVAMMWPPQNTDGSISVTYHRVFMSDETQNFFGPWGIFHLLQASHLVRSKYGSQYQVTTKYDGMKVTFNLSANSVANPFDLKLLQHYSCPQSF